VDIAQQLDHLVEREAERLQMLRETDAVDDLITGADGVKPFIRAEFGIPAAFDSGGVL
jgi:hypothetical protein